MGTCLTRHALCLLLVAAAAGAAAQDRGTVEPHALAPLAHPDDPKTPAKQLFGRVTARRARKPMWSDFTPMVALRVAPRSPSTALHGR